MFFPAMATSLLLLSTITGLLSKNDVSVRADDTLPTMFGLVDVIFFHGWHFQPANQL